MQQRLALAMFVLTLTACANTSGAKMGLFSANAPVLAILHDDLFIGEATGYLDGTGTIDVRSELDSSVKCVGEFRYRGMKTGVASLRCNDGTEAVLSFNSLTALSGYGYGKSTRGPASFTYGLTPEESAERLTLPLGKKLIKNAEKAHLENI